MRNFWAIFKRELAVYFTSPMAYAILVIFLIIAGYMFSSTVSYYAFVSLEAARNPYLAGLNVADAVLNPLFANLSVVMLLMLPALTMRLLAEEKKSGTFELLFTYPLRDIEVVLGKYAAVLAVFAVMLGLTATYQILLAFLGKSAGGVALAGYLGLFLAGAAFLSLGLFVSSLSENQIVAAVVTFGCLLLLYLAGWSSAMIQSDLGKVLTHLSLIEHFKNFSKGVVDTTDLVYYACFIFFFLFLSLRTLESKRWRG